MLLLASDEEGTGSMSNEQVRDEALTIFLAGHETTANALTWTWYLLSQNPDAEAKFHAELDTVLNGRPPEPADFARLPYTTMVFSESLRLQPPAWAIGRMAKHRVQLGDYWLEPRTIALASPYVTHRDPRWYPDPERFDPERWTPEARAARPKFAFVPFGGGARVCIGEHFAWMEGVLLLAAIGQRWRFRLAEGQRVDHQALITLRPALRHAHGARGKISLNDFSGRGYTGNTSGDRCRPSPLNSSSHRRPLRSRAHGAALPLISSPSVCPSPCCTMAAPC